MAWYLAVGAYVALCTTHLFYGLHSERRLFKAATKVAPVALLLFLAGAAMSASRASIFEGSSGSARKLYCLIWGLILSGLGDVYLVFPQFFTVGVVAFAIAQSIYTSMFGGGLALLMGSSLAERAVGVAIGVVTISTFLYAVSNMKGVMKGLGLAYAALITFMLWSATVLAMRAPSDATVLGATGAALFYSSDLMLTVDKWGTKLPMAQTLIMTTYYTAQLFFFGFVLGLK